MDYVFNNKLPNWVNTSETSRGVLEDSNAGKSIRQSTWSAEGGTIPIIYGRQRIGSKIALLKTTVTDLWLLAVFCEGEVQEVEEIQINDSPIDDWTGTVTYTVYTGTMLQTPDPGLVSIYPSGTYTDSLAGTCYAVIKVPLNTPQMSGFPRISAIVVGKKVYDPRDANQNQTEISTWTYSNNPSLCLADFIVSSSYGLGKVIDWNSVALCANHNDVSVPEVTQSTATSTWPTAPMWNSSTKTLADNWTPDLVASYIVELVQDWKDTTIPNSDRPVGEAILFTFLKWLTGTYSHNQGTNAILGKYDGISWYMDGDEPTDTEFYWTSFNGSNPNAELVTAKLATPVTTTINGVAANTAWPDVSIYHRIYSTLVSNNWCSWSGVTYCYSPYSYEHFKNRTIEGWTYYRCDSWGSWGYLASDNFFDPNTGIAYIKNSNSNSDKFTKYWLFSGKLRALVSSDTKVKAKELDLVIDVEQETTQWIETLRGYASCFITTDGSIFKLVPDSPIGYGFNALGSSTSYVSLPNYVTNTTFPEFSLEVTVKPTGTSGGTQTIVGKGTYGAEDYALLYDKTNHKLKFRCTDLNQGLLTWEVDGVTLDTNSASTISVNIDAYAHGKVFLTNELGATSQLTITNSPSVLSDVNPLAIVNTTGAAVMFAYNGTASTAFTGLVDEFRAWNRCRTDSETILYATQPLIDNTDFNLLYHLTFNEGVKFFTKVSASTAWTESTLALDKVSGEYATIYGSTTTDSAWTQHDGRYDFYNFNTSNIIEGSLKFRKKGVRNIPTIVELAYTDNTTSPWKEDYVVVNQTAANADKYRVSRVPMPGVTRYTQAYYEAVERYNSIVQDTNVAFQAFDDSIHVDIGEGIQVHHPIIETNQGGVFKPFRVTGLQQIDPLGLWSISAIEYDPAIYGLEPVTNTTYAYTDMVSGVGNPGARGVTGATGATGVTGAIVNGSTGATGATGVYNSSFMYGFGADGDATLNGTNTYAWCGLSGGNTYEFNQGRGAELNNLTINSGITLKPLTYPIIVKGTLTLNGKITRNGDNATFNSTAVPMFYSQGFDGYLGPGHEGHLTGPNEYNPNALFGGLGGIGGNGGASADYSAYTNGTIVHPAEIKGGLGLGGSFWFLTTGQSHDGSTVHGGAGGIGGRASIANSTDKAAGGAGGGFILIHAKNMTGSGTIEAKGGDGAKAAYSDTGGGGGGGGGVVVVMTSTENWNSLITVDVSGGTGGTGTIGAYDGTRGSTGRLMYMVI